MLRPAGMMKERRHEKVVALLRTELTEILRREVKDSRIHHLTITMIDLKPDLRSATVFVSLIPVGEGFSEPTKEQRDEVMQGLKSASHFIYEALKRRLVMKVIPSIRFEYDIHMADLSHIWGLLEKTKRDREGDSNS